MFVFEALRSEVLWIMHQCVLASYSWKGGDVINNGRQNPPCYQNIIIQVPEDQNRSPGGSDRSVGKIANSFISAKILPFSEKAS